MDAAADTLFYPFSARILPVPDGARVIFFNAVAHASLKMFAPSRLTLQQNFKPLADRLTATGFDSVAGMPEELQPCDMGLLLFPKNIMEGRFLLHQLSQRLADGAIILCAASNKSGGARLKKIMYETGFQSLQEVSKNKARVVWGFKRGAISSEEAVQGGLQKTLLGFFSQPGLFSWDRIDQGSEILARHLSDGLQGRVADFGCGYGYLARQILKNHAEVQTLYCIDADARAVEAARRNLEIFHPRVQFLWADLEQDWMVPRDLDAIIMNPPFHQGAHSDISIGKNFISTAFSCLRKGGELWMVANVHLPYEQPLREKFSKIEKIYEKQGFKVYRGVK